VTAAVTFVCVLTVLTTFLTSKPRFGCLHLSTAVVAVLFFATHTLHSTMFPLL
jgi:hypothetical protein